MKKNRHSRNDETNACCLHFVELKLEKSTHDVTANLPKIYQINLKITPPQPDIWFHRRVQNRGVVEKTWVDGVAWLGFRDVSDTSNGKSLLDVERFRVKGSTTAADWKWFEWLQFQWVWRQITKMMGLMRCHFDFIFWIEISFRSQHMDVKGSTEWYDIVWYDIVWYDMMWCDVIFYVFLRRWSHPKKRRSLEAF